MLPINNSFYRNDDYYCEECGEYLDDCECEDGDDDGWYCKDCGMSYYTCICPHEED